MSTASPPYLYGTLRTILIGYGVAGFSWLFIRKGAIEDPFAANASSTARTLFVIGIACQLVALLAHRWIKRRIGDDRDAVAKGTGILELITDGVTVLLFAIATFNGLFAFGDSL